MIKFDLFKMVSKKPVAAYRCSRRALCIPPIRQQKGISYRLMQKHFDK